MSFIFSVTNAKVQSESEEIWKYQVYSIIVDFETRLRLPAPLNFISYIIMLLEFIFKKVKHLIGKCCKSSCCRRKDALVICDLDKPCTPVKKFMKCGHVFNSVLISFKFAKNALLFYRMFMLMLAFNDIYTLYRMLSLYIIL